MPALVRAVHVWDTTPVAVVGDVASLVSALTGSTALLLAELRVRRPKSARSDDDLRVKLLTLEEALFTWHEVATATSVAARAWAEARESVDPASPDRMRATEELYRRITVNTQAAHFTMNALKCVPTSYGGDIETLLRVYSPELRDLADRVQDRLDRVENLVAELELWYVEGGRGAVDAGLAELDRTQRALAEAQRQVTDFLRIELPLARAETRGSQGSPDA
jgi:hypothetical protein